MDPVSMIVTALAAGASAALKPTAEQAVKDAYAALKKVITSRFAGVSLEMLERKPESETQRSSVREVLAEADAGSDPEVIRTAVEVVEVVKRHAPEDARAIGLNIGEIAEGLVHLKEVIATQGASGTNIGANVDRVAGSLTVDRVTAGP